MYHRAPSEQVTTQRFGGGADERAVLAGAHLIRCRCQQTKAHPHENKSEQFRNVQNTYLAVQKSSTVTDSEAERRIVFHPNYMSMNETCWTILYYSCTHPGDFNAVSGGRFCAVACCHVFTSMHVELTSTCMLSTQGSTAYSALARSRHITGRSI